MLVPMAAGAPKPSAVVFLREGIEIGLAMPDVVGRLCRDGSVLLPLAGAATTEGGAQLLRVGPMVAGRSIGVPVEVRIGPRWTRDGTIAVPIRWEAAVLGALFPVLDGTLVFSRLGAARTRLELEASYRPPMDAVGELLDRTLLHRVAEATVRSFLQRMADSLVAATDPGGGGAFPDGRGSPDGGTVSGGDRGTVAGGGPEVGGDWMDGGAAAGRPLRLVQASDPDGNGGPEAF